MLDAAAVARGKGHSLSMNFLLSFFPTFSFFTKFLHWTLILLTFRTFQDNLNLNHHDFHDPCQKFSKGISAGIFFTVSKILPQDVREKWGIVKEDVGKRSIGPKRRQNEKKENEKNITAAGGAKEWSSKGKSCPRLPTLRISDWLLLLFVLVFGMKMSRDSWKKWVKERRRILFLLSCQKKEWWRENEVQE